MWLIEQIAYVWYLMYRFFFLIAYTAVDIPFVGDDLKDFFLDVAHWFYELDQYDEVVETCLYARTLAFGEWVEAIYVMVGVHDTWSSVIKLVIDWSLSIPNIIKWFSDSTAHILTIITTWWESTNNPIRVIITAVQDSLNALTKEWNNFWTVTWPGWTKKLDDLKATWDTFWEELFPDLINSLDLGAWWDDKIIDVQKWVNDKLTDLAPAWEGWLDFKQSVSDFFADPVEYIWARFTNWFVGPEE